MKVIRPAALTNAAPQDRLTVGVAQIAPVWFRRTETLNKIIAALHIAADEGCELVTFGEALVPGYPFWIERTGGAKFNDAKQKAMYARYLEEGVIIERGDLAPLCAAANKRQIAVYLGIMERAPDRGAHSLYCTLVYIDKSGNINSVHRKLHPTHEERLAWAQGDGHGLVVHQMGAFTVGGLNCYENWMPLARAALYAQGESLHVSVWPGGLHNTKDLPVFIAKESRSYVIAACGLMRVSDLPKDTPNRVEIIAAGSEIISNGGSTIVAPDGTFMVEPVTDIEALIVAEIDHSVVRGERQNLDLFGHYARPDVLELHVNRARQSGVKFTDG
ncbi:MAG: carbon-nitrogen hydrolase family protein [Rhodobacteraceae bacterium]|nr:carbon-nitrogen hydrolase family protein [Paracoccaceae bacterium]PHR54561.1 MAG: carbon-nitrogen hydrolase [Robiginitomaculum sp.]